MAYRDVLLAIVSYPDATPLAAIDGAVRIARRIGGQVTALGVQIHTETPANVMAEALPVIEKVAAAELAKSTASIEAALARFQADARTIGLTAFTTVGLSHVYDEGAVVVGEARTHDICLVPIGPTTQSDQIIAEQLLFESGRPVLLCPEVAPSDGATGPYQHIAIAWDGSRPAARAVGDAMPLLGQAHDVRLLTVVNEKPSAPSGLARELVRHLGQHGVRCHVDEVDLAGRQIPEVFEAYVLEKGIELLVMGGYAHSRTRELRLGGATAGVLANPVVPTLMSH